MQPRICRRQLVPVFVFLMIGLQPIVRTTVAQVPLTLSYQGLLTDDQGQPVLDGSYTLVISLYDAESGGAGLWSETHAANVTGGVFSLVLGSTTPLALPFDRPYWLGAAINGGPELEPRVALTASPYSLNGRATVAEPAAGQSLAVRDADGFPAHLLSTDGSAVHTGLVTIEGGLLVGDSTIVAEDTTFAGKRMELQSVGIRAGGIEIGVLGSSDPGIGVQGQTDYGVGVFGRGIRGSGVVGISQQDNGVEGEAQGGFGVWGKSQSAAGVRGQSGTGPGVYGRSGSNKGGEFISVTSTGVRGVSQSSDGIGIQGESPGVAGRFLGRVEITHTLKVDEVPEDPTNMRALVWGDDQVVKWRTMPDGGGGDGVFEEGIRVPLANGATAAIMPNEGWSIKNGSTFLAHNDPNGNAYFAGTLQAGAKNFKIDHPLAPTERYLQHVSVESPDMMNIYNGNVTTDESGFATVILPAYFEALNRDFRYQLTVVGQFAQAIVAAEVADNRFVIQTDHPAVKVSWQVTGIRHDPFAERYRVQVEGDKLPEEKGTYLHPAAYAPLGTRVDAAAVPVTVH